MSAPPRGRPRDLEENCFDRGWPGTGEFPLIEIVRTLAVGALRQVSPEVFSPHNATRSAAEIAALSFRVAARSTRRGVTGTGGRRVSAVGGITTAAERDVPLVEAEARFARLRLDQARRLFSHLASPDAANPDVAHD